MNEPQPPAPDPQSPQLRQHVSARVPEHVRAGAFSTGAIVMTGATEFVLDFVQNIGPPAQVAARVVMPHGVMPRFIEALKTNLQLFTKQFGAPPQLPKGQPHQRQPTPQEIYDDLKLPDHIMVGAYANGVMISHTASEFKLDFLTNLFPHPAVSCRVFLSSPQVPRLLESLQGTFHQFQTRLQQQKQQQIGGQQTPTEERAAEPPTDLPTNQAESQTPPDRPSDPPLSDDTAND